MSESLSPNNPSSIQKLSRYVCEECGKVFHLLDDYTGHYKNSHPRSIGTAITQEIGYRRQEYAI